MSPQHSCARQFGSLTGKSVNGYDSQDLHRQARCWLKQPDAWNEDTCEQVQNSLTSHWLRQRTRAHFEVAYPLIKCLQRYLSIDVDMVEHLVAQWSHVVHEQQRENVPFSRMAPTATFVQDVLDWDIPITNWMHLIRRCQWHAKRAGSIPDATLADGLFRQHLPQMEENHRKALFEGILTAWAKCGQPRQAQDLWDYVVDESPETPTLVAFHCLLAAYASVNDSSKVEQLMEQIQQEDRWQTDVVTWTTAMRAVAMKSAEQTEDLFRQMQRAGVQPNLASYKTLLRAWARRSDGLQRCQEIWEEMHEMKVPLDWYAYNSLMEAHCVVKQYDEALDVWEDGLRVMLQQDAEPLPPRVVKNLNILMGSFARQGNVEQVWRIVHRMDKLNALGHLRRRATTHNFNALLFALLMRPSEDAATTAESIMSEMQSSSSRQPDMESYALLVQVLLTSNDSQAFDKALEAARKALYHLKRDSKRPSVAVKTLRAIILAFCRADRPEAAEEILVLLCELAEEQRTTKPDMKIFSAVVQAWGRSSHLQAAVRAEKVVATWKELYRQGLVSGAPDIGTWRVLLSCWNRSSLQGFGQQVYDLTMKIRSQTTRADDKNGGLNTFVYNQSLLSLGRARMVQEAEKILHLMHNDHYSNTSIAAKPDCESYSAVIGAILNDSRVGVDFNERVTNVLQMVNKVNAKVNESTYDRILSFCDEKELDVDKNLLTEHIVERKSSKSSP